MTDFLSKISGQIAGPIILGAFFPVVLFVVVVTFVVLPITPCPDLHHLTDVASDPKLWQQGGIAVLVITFAVLVLSVVLYNMNTPIIRMYEGYPWSESWIGRSLVRRQCTRFGQASLWRRSIRKLRREVRVCGIEGEFELRDLIEVQRKTARMLNDEYPNAVGLVLPTRLGNVIRSFETYTTNQYGAPAISLWPRLQGILDTSYAQGLEATKTTFDFMLHSAFLSALAAALVVVSGMTWHNPVEQGIQQPWIAWSLFFALVSYLFYLAAVNRAAEWGLQIKATFDLYRLPLLQRLGFEQKPADIEEERRMWNLVNYRFSFPDDSAYPDLPYRSPQTYFTVDPISTMMTWRRTVVPLDDGSTEIRIEVSNTDSARRDARQVVLRDDIPAGKMYIRDSASVSGTPAVLLDISPLKIDLGALPYYDSRVIIFRIKSQAP